VLSAQGTPAAPVRVGGNLRPPTKTRDVRPVCPASVPETDTVVRLTGRIGMDGTVIDLALAPGTELPVELTSSALDAVRQWTFTPTLLNGQPVAVDISVTITFRRSGV
jgi:TonB-like protein